MQFIVKSGLSLGAAKVVSAVQIDGNSCSADKTHVSNADGATCIIKVDKCSTQ